MADRFILVEDEAQGKKMLTIYEYQKELVMAGSRIVGEELARRIVCDWLRSVSLGDGDCGDDLA